MTADGMMLQEELSAKLAEAHGAANAMRASAKAAARARRDWRRELAVRMLRLRSEGMAASVVKDAAMGDESVSQREYLMLCAEAERDADREVVNIAKREADVLRDQLRVDWAQAGVRPW